MGSNKASSSFRIIKIDRTLIERPPEQSTAYPTTSSVPHSSSGAHKTPSSDGNGNIGGEGSGPAGMAESSHTAKPTLRPLSDFVTEDPNVYTETEIREILDTIDCGNRTSQSTLGQSAQHRPHHGGLKPIVKAYGLVGYIRFLVSVCWRNSFKVMTQSCTRNTHELIS